WVGAAAISRELSRSAGELRLQAQNPGPPVTMRFAPELPFGARLRDAQVGDQRLAATLVQEAQDTHARMELPLPHGRTSLTVRYDGGVSIVVPRSPPRVGDASRAPRIIGLNLAGETLTIEVQHLASLPSTFELRTPWTITGVEGATLAATTPSAFRFDINASPGSGQGAYERSK